MMKARILLLLATIFSLAQGPLLPSVFSEGFFVVGMMLGLDDAKKISIKWVTVVFAIGFLFDLVQGKRLGVTPLLFGVLVLGAARVKGGFLEKPAFLAAVVFLADVARARLLFGEFMIAPALMAGVLAFIFFKLVWRPAAPKLNLMINEK